jgi:hypothetical protein
MAYISIHVQDQGVTLNGRIFQYRAVRTTGGGVIGGSLEEEKVTVPHSQGEAEAANAAIIADARAKLDALEADVVTLSGGCV